jgi:Icc-related predicted phosphoesterase
MRLQILSDIHFDVDRAHPGLRLVDGADVLIVAGDVCEGAEPGFAWLRHRFGDEVPIITIAGNHTFYGRCLKDEIATAREKATHYGIHFLENDTLNLGGVTFAGCTLWTDYNLFGAAFRAYAMREAMSKMMDHRKISWSKQPWKRFTPMEACYLHHASRQFLEETLSQPRTGKTVVITHHAPSRTSLSDFFRDSLLSAAYASDLEQLIDALKPDIWIHGHTHQSSDYLISATRIVCNPHGYGRENPSFKPTLLIDV